MEKQDWEGKCLDKDILIKNNKVYSPDTCIFVAMELNMFLTDRAALRGELMIGVSRKGNKYQAQCCNPFTKKIEYLGVFHTEIEAHTARKEKKHAIACIYASKQKNPKLSEALLRRFL